MKAIVVLKAWWRTS
ncbi:trp operon leader peptide [Escherichia coli]|nr:trp operon leader peptide [Escherichia coli]RXA57612.1 trp operon leader peptide [Escherichia coli]